MKYIELTQGKRTIVDDSDYDQLIKHNWCVYKSTSGRYYASRNNGRKNKGGHYLLKMHRVIMGLQKYDKRQIDHINGDSLDNRRCNLRIVTPQQNSWNRKAQKNSASGVRGVHRHTQTGKWVAQIKLGNKRVHLGCFDSIEKAKKVYEAEAIKHYGEYYPRT